MIDDVRKNILPKYAADKLRLSVTPVLLISIGGVQADVQYMIGGPDVKKLEQYATAVMADLRKAPGARDVDSSISTGKPQFGVRIDRAKAAELGVSVADAANTLRLLVAGGKVSDYYEKGEQYEVHVRSVANARNRLEELEMVTVPSSKWGNVPLGDIVRFDESTGPAEINRFARTRQVTINANLAPGASQQIVQDELEKSVAQLKMGPDYKTGLLGRSKEMAKMQRAFLTAFVMAFLFVYLCLAAQFESWAAPDHDPLVAALDRAICLAFAIPLAPIDQHFLAIGHSGVVRGGEEERDLADRPHQPTPRGRDGEVRSDCAGQPRPSPPHLDDHGGLRRRHDPHAGVQR